ncbi:sirohydrochlorin chelatase [Aquibacillus koreensis]|uniref:Sirohydrochlorin chelatase n=1 Tax=Aquibacillus koreensis TaxID=279446 RepID=A0A9X4AH72_9BACI|nr:sirohydrochlorin chelatase [Aquibacillus koreensis]MCT2536503.1 sirohydrochlorin chelatase [Aquibacillus koreensis]MDC3419409.1 sirohydrochlorin chelatase [Aquibacillus koreensis]
MDAIVYVGHGSRAEARNKEFIQFMDMVYPQIPVDVQTYAFLELAEPSITDAVTDCIRKGATRVTVVPILLLSGIHVVEDIPNEIAEICSQYPNIDIDQVGPLGADEVVVNVLKARLDEAIGELPNKKAVLLISHGSRNKDAPHEFEQLASQLKEMLPFDADVSTAYLKTTQPSIEQQLEKMAMNQYDEIYVIPHFLFAGGFVKTIENVLDNYHDRMPKTKLICCEPTGFDQSYTELIEKRLE